MTELGVPTRRRGRRGLWIVAGAAVVLLAGGAAYAWTAMSPSGFTIKGDLTITSDSQLKWGTSTAQCAGAGGFSDISEAATVVVTDAAGKTVAIGRMDGEGKATRGTGLAAGVRPAACTWTWTVEDVPGGSGFYGIEISHRGRQQYTREQLGEPIHLRLG